jgi:hypothetical protein
MKKIIYKTETGIAIITPTISVELAIKDIPEGAEYKIVDESELTTDRTFRGALGYDLKEDIDKSKEIWKDKLRSDRSSLLSDLDVQYQRADEEKDDTKKSEIVKEKKRLRDITKVVDKCKSIDEIKAVSV